MVSLDIIKVYQLLPLFSFSGIDVNGSKRLSPTPSVSNLKRIYGHFPSVDQSGRFAGVPNLGNPLERERTAYIKTHKTAINRPVDHTGEENELKEISSLK